MLRFLILLANILSLASIANSQQTSSVPQRVLAASFLAGSPDDAGRLMGHGNAGFHRARRRTVCWQWILGGSARDW